MKASGRTLAVIFVCGLLAGCAGPTPQQLRIAEDGRVQVARILDQFSEAMATQSPGVMRSLLSPAVRERVARRLESDLGWASWLTLHAGYTLQSDRALDRISWRKWQEPTLLVEIKGHNTYNAEFEDTFELARVEGAWYLTDFRTTMPQRGSPIDPPGGVREAIAPRAAIFLEALADGKTGTILYELLPDGTSTVRRPITTWWQRITGRAPRGPVPIYLDLERTLSLSFSDWPDPLEDMELAFAPPNGVIAIYEVRYTWRGAGLGDTEYLRVELSFMPSGDGWQLRRLYLSGKAIPFTT